MPHSLAMTGGGLLFIFLMTCLGASAVLFFRQATSGFWQRVFLGFAAGIMIAASVWSLLLPAMEEAGEQGWNAIWIPAAGGFVMGVLFLLALDNLIPHLHQPSGLREGPSAAFRRPTLLVFAITLHNIPEGMAVGLAFALAARSGNSDLFASAVALAIGIGLQNIPEGAAVALPLRQEGMSAAKAFWIGCLSGAVEPVFGALAVLLVAWMIPVMPWLLAFTAGAMLYVVVEELIPEMHAEKHSHAGTLSAMAGFLLMMVLDVALG